MIPSLPLLAAGPAGPVRSGTAAGARDSRFTRTDRILLAVLTAWAAVVLVHGAATWPLGIDESWHLYYADVEPLSKAIREWATDAHPPLTYALLRPITALSGDPFVGRLASVVPALVQPWLLFGVLRRLGVARAVAHSGTLLFTISQAFAVIGVVVRSYALATTFGLIALGAALDLLVGAKSPRSRAIVLLGSVALGTGSLYALPLTAVGVALAFVIAGWSEGAAAKFGRDLWHATRRPERIAFVASIAAVAAFYLVTWFHREFHHLDPWLMEPGADPMRFMVVGAAWVLATFTPLDLTASGAAASVAAGVVVLTAGAGVVAHRRGGALGVARATAIWAVLGIVLVFLVLAWLRVYPFGGELRHQYPLFVLGVIAMTVGLDVAYRSLPSRRLRAATLVVVLAVGVTTTLRSFATGLPEIPSGVVWRDAAAAVFERDDPRPVCLPNVGFIAFYGRFLDRRWELVESDRGFEVFETRRPPRTFVRHRSTWSLEVVPDREFLISLRRFCVDRDLTALRVCAVRPGEAASVDERRRREASVHARCAEFGFRLVEWEVLPAGEVLVLERDGP